MSFLSHTIRPRVIALVIGVAFASVVTAVVGCSSEEPLPPPLPVDEATLARGKELVEGLAACGSCHGAKPVPGAPLSGGQLEQDKFGAVLAPNITFHKSGLGTWTESNFLEAFRSNLTPDGSGISREFHGGYEWLSDYDLSGIVSYLRTLPKVDNTVDHRSLTFVDRNTTGFLDAQMSVKGYVPRIPDTFKVEYGQYLTDHVARCASCHSTPSGVVAEGVYMGGGREIIIADVTKVAPNLSRSKEYGIGRWSVSDIEKYLETGAKPDGSRVDTRFCPIAFFSKASAKDLSAVASYVASVPPVE